MNRTKCEVVVEGTYGTYTVPSGTRVHEIRWGINRSGWVVSSKADAIKAGMSAHDATYYWIFIPKDKVEAEMSEDFG